MDAVLDLVGDDALADAPSQVFDSARIASVIEPDTVLEQGGHHLFVRPDRGHLDELARLADEGRLRVTVARTFDPAEIADAHRLTQEGHPGGKIVVRNQPSLGGSSRVLRPESPRDSGPAKGAAGARAAT